MSLCIINPNKNTRNKTNENKTNKRPETKNTEKPQSRPDDLDHLKGFSLDTRQLETSMERN